MSQQRWWHLSRRTKKKLWKMVKWFLEVVVVGFNEDLIQSIIELLRGGL